MKNNNFDAKQIQSLQQAVRLNGLALAYIHKTTDPNWRDASGHRRIALAFIKNKQQAKKLSLFLAFGCSNQAKNQKRYVYKFQ